MICQRCGENEATVHMTKIVNGEKSEMYLCEKCAEETGQIPFKANEPFSFQSLLSGLLNPKINSTFTDNTEVLKCENCGMSYREFSKKGLFGCSECYQTFGERLDPLIKRIHGSNEHHGKIPKRMGGNLRIKREIEELRNEMDRAVEKEDFEKAAELRDEIHELESKFGGKQDVSGGQEE